MWVLILAGLAVLVMVASKTEIGTSVIETVRQTVLSGFDRYTLDYPQPDEVAQMIEIGARYHVDPSFLAAIRIQENGRPGREFGVLSVSAPDYMAQLTSAAITVAHTMARYRSNMGADPIGGDGRYTDEFIQYFGYGGPGYPGWAPLDAPNDPNGLNDSWVSNVEALYSQITVSA